MEQNQSEKETEEDPDIEEEIRNVIQKRGEKKNLAQGEQRKYL